MWHGEGGYLDDSALKDRAPDTAGRLPGRILDHSMHTAAAPEVAHALVQEFAGTASGVFLDRGLLEHMQCERGSGTFLVRRINTEPRQFPMKHRLTFYVPGWRHGRAGHLVQDQGPRRLPSTGGGSVAEKNALFHAGIASIRVVERPLLA